MTEDRARLKALEDAYFQGVTTVEHDGKRVTYRSLKEMEHLISVLSNRVGGNRASKVETPGFDRGYQ